MGRRTIHAPKVKEVQVSADEYIEVSLHYDNEATPDTIIIPPSDYIRLMRAIQSPMPPRFVTVDRMDSTDLDVCVGKSVIVLAAVRYIEVGPVVLASTPGDDGPEEVFDLRTYDAMINAPEATPAPKS